MKHKKEKIKIGVSIGDLNGIGIEVILKTFKDNRIMDFCTPIIFGSNKIISQHKKILNIQESNFNIINSIKDVNYKKPNLLNISKEEIELTIGSASKKSGKFSFDSITAACESLKNKEIDVLVTAPINKSSIQKTIKNFIGHTEFLEGNFPGDSLMIMISEFMKIAFVTGHIPLSKVQNNITTQLIIKKATQLNNSLVQDFGCSHPKIAILGINPHAGEETLLGNEEKDIILPAIKELKNNKIMAFGPYPTDSFFMPKNLTAFDGILAMYHDQGLTPFKTLSFQDGVNYTSGLNIIRTSPVHGTAYEIAGQGEANEQSFRSSIFLACDIFKQRMRYKELNSN